MSNNKRFKRETTLLEQLPNELFIEIVSYLNGVDALYAFSQLNTRFQHVTSNYCSIFDFKSVSKAKFDFVIRREDKQQWRWLCLSDDFDTPGQITLFFRQVSLANDLSELRSLTLVNSSQEDKTVLLSQINSLVNLESLSIDSICGKDISPIDLPLLKRLIVSSCCHTDWMKNMTQLENLKYTIHDVCGYGHYTNILLQWPHQLKQLEMFQNYNINSSTVLTALRQLSQLTRLAVCHTNRLYSLPNGQVWEELIGSSLPMLKIFQFYFLFTDYNLTTDMVNQVIASFSTPFYLYVKCWYVQCDVNYKLGYVNLYTLPFAFEQFTINTKSFVTSLSTLFISKRNGASQKLYTNVKTLVLDQIFDKPAATFSADTIVHLIVNISEFSVGWQVLWTRLTHLTFGHQVTMSSAEFAHLLNNMPNLHALTATMSTLERITDKWAAYAVCGQLWHKIRSLTVTPDDSFTSGYKPYIRVREIPSLIRVFSGNCEHLTLRLKSSNIIANTILKRMQALRSLKISHRWGKIDAKWLEQHPNVLNESDYWRAYKCTFDQLNFCVWFGNRP